MRQLLHRGRERLCPTSKHREVTYMLNVEDARSELESVKEASSGIASEIESKVDELTTIKDNLEDGVSQLEDYIYALQGIEDTLENLENARNEAEDHDISY